MMKNNRYQLRDSHGDGSTRPTISASIANADIPDEDFNRKYDLTPLGSKKFTWKEAGRSQQFKNTQDITSPGNQSYTIDPWEVASLQSNGMDSIESNNTLEFDSNRTDDSHSVKRFKDDDNVDALHRSSFILPSDIHPRMEEREDDIAQLRLLAGKLNADWGAVDFMAPKLARRIRDFQFAQEKRRKKYGHEKPWGILGLYDHLTAIRTDIEWAEDAAWRRVNGQP